MTKRLAITISGAVSLGSYEAGVLYEIVNAIGQHNSDPATSAAEKIEIDVITGASAGGMTAAIAVQKLLFEADSLTDPYNNSFYRPWVQDVSIQALLALQSGEDPTHSILSSNLVEAISKKHITARYAALPVPPSRVRHPASAASIRLGLALSNLNGVDYTRDMRPDGKFTYTRHQDKLTTAFDSAEPDQFDKYEPWEVVRNACVSCGAFPLAFRCKDLVRHKQEYDQEFLDPRSFPSDTSVFTYTDGGVFQNEPLGMAKDFVDAIDTHLNLESRFYLFVSPGAAGATPNSAFNESKATFAGTLSQLLGGVIGQAQFHDWITAEQVNDKVNLFNDRALRLQQAILRNPGAEGYLDFNVLIPASGALLTLLFPNGMSSVGETRGNAWHRLQSQFSSEYATLERERGKAAADAWMDAILAFETAADLGDKDEMVIYGITAKPSELAGADVHAFQGFCDLAFRDHDYDVGRTKACEFIDKINDSGSGLAPIRYTKRPPIRPIDAKLNGLTIGSVDRELRQQLKSALTNSAHDLMAELNIGFAEREVIDFAFISPQLSKILGV